MKINRQATVPTKSKNYGTKHSKDFTHKNSSLYRQKIFEIGKKCHRNIEQRSLSKNGKSSRPVPKKSVQETPNLDVTM